MRELSRLAVDVSEEEVLRAREQLKASLTLHLEGGTSAIGALPPTPQTPPCLASSRLRSRGAGRSYGSV